VSSQPEARKSERERLLSTIEHVSGAVEDALGAAAELVLEEVGEVTYVGHGIARVTGLSSVQSEELVRFPRGLMGMAFTLSATGRACGPGPRCAGPAG
jgi:F0F1-type ATP synthase alpha subunit